jgi:acetamidase/formamidase
MNKKIKESDLFHLRCTPESVHWGYLSANIEPVAHVKCGQDIIVDTVSGNSSRLPKDSQQFPILIEHQEILSRYSAHIGPHILTGPIHVDGAKRGDLLAVEILDVRLRQNWGWNEIERGTGALPELEDGCETLTIPIDLETSTIHLPWAGKVKAAPFFGVMAVMPSVEAGEVSSLIPGVFGGNMDLRLLQPGATIFLPIHVDGAGFSVGDGHALQGDGEVVGTAVETALTGVFRLNVAVNCGARFPFIKTPDTIVATAVASNLDDAVTLALHDSIRLLTHYFDISEKNAYRHVSLMADIHVAQVVNTAKGIYIKINTQTLPPNLINE